MLMFLGRKSKLSYFQILVEHLRRPAMVFNLDQLDQVPPVNLTAAEKKLHLDRLNPMKAMGLPVRYQNWKVQWLPGQRQRLEWHVFVRLVGLLRQWKPRAVAVWNGQRFPTSVAVEAARLCGVPIAFMELGALPNTTTLDLQGVNACNSVPRDPDFYRQLSVPTPDVPAFQTRSTRHGTIQASIELPERFFFVPFQVEKDTQLVLHSPWIRSMNQLFNTMVGLLEDLPEDFHLVFRRHPSDKTEHKHLLRQSGKRVHFADANPMQELLSKCEAVVTLNSSVGIEGLCLQRPVVVLGRAFYDIPGVCRHAAHVDELRQILKSGAYLQQNPLLVQRFLGYLQHRYYIPGHWSKPDEGHIRAVRSFFDQHWPES